jgi:hypothetical protein
VVDAAQNFAPVAVDDGRPAAWNVEAFGAQISDEIRAIRGACLAVEMFARHRAPQQRIERA